MKHTIKYLKSRKADIIAFVLWFIIIFSVFWFKSYLEKDIPKCKIWDIVYIIK